MDIRISNRIARPIIARGILSILSLFLLPLAAGLLHASVTIDYTAQIGQRNVVDHSGATVPADHGEVRVGVIADDFDIEAHGGDLHRLGDAWIGLGSTPIREILGQPSRFSARAVFQRPELTAQKLYLWVITTTDGGPVAQDLGNVLDYGIFSSTATNWKVPSEGALQPENSTLINSSQVDQIFGAGELTSESLKLTVPAPGGLDYTAWATNAFPANTPEADKDPSADPDNDELSNLMEMFTGGDPMTAGPPPFATLIGDDSIVFEFERSKDVPADAGSLYISANLTDWVEAGAAAEVIAVADLGDREKVSMRLLPDQMPAAWAGRLVFIRLRVEG